MTDNAERHPAHPFDEDPEEQVGRPVRVNYETGEVEILGEVPGDIIHIPADDGIQEARDAVDDVFGGPESAGERSAMRDERSGDGDPDTEPDPAP